MDSEQVLSARIVRLSAGYAVVRFETDTTRGTYSTAGTGANLESAVGLGYNLELGARLGFRPDRPGRGLRADEAARAFNRVTIGTGVGTLANPELLLRWRAMQASGNEFGAEFGVEYRVVVPTFSDQDVTNILGPWVSVHWNRVMRVDAAFDGILASRRFATQWVAQTAIGGSIRLWVNVTPALFAGLLATAHSFARTPYTAEYILSSAGMSVGYRVDACDAHIALRSLAAAESFLSRIGAGIGIDCRLAVP